MKKKVQAAVTVSEATPAEYEDRDRVAFAAWGMKLSLEQFLDRERRLRATAWAGQALRGWLLRGLEGEVLSSCETFRMTMPLRAGSGEVEPGGSRAVEAFASVLTEPRLRGRGYATRLLGLVMERARAVDPSLAGFALYSEVGTAIYERAGFRALESAEWVYPAEATTSEAGAAEIARLETPELARRLLPGAHPPLEQLEWHWERERFYAETLSRPRSLLRGLGCGRAGRLARGAKGVSAWAADWKGSCLRALVFDLGAFSTDRVAEGAVLAAARAEARRLGLDDVRVWETPGARGRPDLGGRRLAREDSIAMVCPVGLDIALPSRGFWV